jgi:hypothetical protein
VILKTFQKWQKFLKSLFNDSNFQISRKEVGIVVIDIVREDVDSLFDNSKKFG